MESILFLYHICCKASSAVPCRATYTTLEAHMIRLEQDVANKQHTLMTDLRCLDMRDVLKKGDLAPPATQIQRNMQLTRIEEEVPEL